MLIRFILENKVEEQMNLLNDEDCSTWYCADDGHIVPRDSIPSFL